MVAGTEFCAFKVCVETGETEKGVTDIAGNVLCGKGEGREHQDRTDILRHAS